MTVPRTKTLTLLAICLSAISIVAAFKIGEARKRTLEAERSGSAVYIDLEQTNESTKILQTALQNLQLNTMLGTSSVENPFIPKENDTLTDALAKNIFLSYAELQNNNALSNDTIANNVINSINTSDLPRSDYSLSNIAISESQTSASIKAYGNRVGAIIKDNYTIIANKKDNIELTEIARLHKAIGNEIINTSVPAALAQQHLVIANSYALLGKSFDIIATEEQNDPLKSLLAIRTAKDASENLNNAYTEVNNYFIKNDILFNNNEPGIIWSTIVVK